ncbi:MAG: OHCU decarboxylase [Pusillimonas sp.]|nr:OHCU decarboxylase [Pusillimonas sp.]
MTKHVTLSELNNMPESQFVSLLGGVFEHSPWVAEGAASGRPYDSVADLHAAMVKQIEQAGEQAQLKLIRAHPELAGKAAVRGELTEESTSEQAGAGLDKCSPEEYARLTELNDAYNNKFGFPFILAVKGYDRAGIIQQFERRLQLSLEDEKRESLQQIYKIGGFRLNDLINET